jgi:hypothetical protein
MIGTRTLCTVLLLAAGSVWADEPQPGGDKTLTGMSIVGNDDAPKSLVIVPWKSSALGDALDVSRALDDGRRAVDRDVFMRELDYYEIRESSGGSGPGANRRMR